MNNIAMIYLIGTDHKNQYIPHGSNKEFCKYLEEQCIEKRINFIGEELSEDAIKKYNKSDSVARNIARTLNIKHKLCDPGTKQRNMLGIKCRKIIEEEIISEYGFSSPPLWDQQKVLKNEADKREKRFWPIRERYWLEKLMEEDLKDSIFILGSEHMGTFSELLKDKGINAEVIIKDWHPTKTD